MRRIGSRIAAQVSIAALLAMALAGPASAAQLIRYEGTTSASDWNEARAYVLKRDSGRRLLQSIALQVTVTCEDAKSEQWTLIVGVGRLGEDGEFSRSLKVAQRTIFLRVDGSFNWGGGSGTVLYNQAKLTADGSDVQLCTTGELTWVVDRANVQPARVTVPDVPVGTGLIKMRETSGVAKIMKLVEPTEVPG